MQLGSETGSLTNYLLSGTKGQPYPEIGMGVTYLSWTDRSPGTIVDVFEKGAYLYIATQADNYERIDKNGMSDCQEYEYTPNPDAGIQYFRRKRNNPDQAFSGTYTKTNGRWVNGDNRIRIGDRDRYYDFSF